MRKITKLFVTFMLFGAVMVSCKGSDDGGSGVDCTVVLDNISTTASDFEASENKETCAAYKAAIQAALNDCSDANGADVTGWNNLIGGTLSDCSTFPDKKD